MNKHEIFARHIANEFKELLTGESQTRVVGEQPQDKFFIGQLASRNEKDNYFSSKVDISQIGVDFYVRAKDIGETQLEIEPLGNIFYRVIPTYEEQRNKLINHLGLKTFDEVISKYEDIKGKKGQENRFKVKLEEVYEKISLADDIKIVVNTREILNEKKTKGIKRISLNNFLDNKLKNFPDNKKYKVEKAKVKVHDLLDKESYENFLKNNLGDYNKFTPDISVDVEIKRIDENYRASVNIVNRTENLRNIKHCKSIFNSGIKIKVINNEVQPFKLNYFKDDYKYKGEVYAKGNNCSVDVLNNQIIKTNNIPTYEQKRLKTKDDVIKVRFDELITNPVQQLNQVLNKMNLELDKWKQDRDIIGLENSKALNQYDEECKAFEWEIFRFRNGIKEIEKRVSVRKSFISMNRTFKENATDIKIGKVEFDSWRLFQIVFIVSQIPDIITSEYKEEIENSKIENVDLLYFPTGGGKTEAFLGATVFTLFFDRIRGKECGVSALIKYPLRLLSIQQVERLSKVLASAENERKMNIKDYPGERFSSGYFVGDNNTPNKLTKENVKNLEGASKTKLNQKYRIIDICPFCENESVEVVFDKENWRLKHICTTKNCHSEGELPIYIVDREIFRYLPSVIVSTIDKIASIGIQSNFRNILGEVTHKCPKHGFTSKSRCVESTERGICNEDIADFEEVNIKDGAPTLIIQDEVHLLRESLGTYNSHYETLIDYFIKKLVKNNKKVKLIGATATVTDYQNQIRQLYNKDAIKFPATSTKLNENFYSKIFEDDLNRIIISYAPYGRAIVNSVVYSMKYFRTILFKYLNNIKKFDDIKGLESLSNKERLNILKDYWIFIEYNNVKRDSNRVEGALENNINIELINEDIPKFKIRKMTGDSNFQEVRKTLSEIDNYDANGVFNGINLISATSMISHGVDTSKFNLMFFFGMPGNTAEYIQAYSRTGRKHPGIVIDIMRPTRDRDLSYLKYFNDFHEYKDLLVEPVPINRWANNAIYSTFSGIFSSLILNYYDFKLKDKYENVYMDKNLKSAIENGDIKAEEVKKHILNIYNCLRDDRELDIAKNYSQVIDETVDFFFEEIKRKSFDGKTYITTLLDELLIEFRQPMNSLRDTDKNVTIELT
ncbi:MULTISPECIES: DEAD/DEAH box helicase family protein [Psychrilyobacter]|uniref:Helicase C-terminal domain-containing protein n=1 Tax=Psychrilyobacter piezotolerans TaxID=2293438 RepID=A0ABX9KJL2_9FUSO|nr:MULTISPECIES: helicase-related protein [Psychrilyobacter]MCS5421727.1 helicase-related protein [Psychrilyobacter sp. S5]NDI77162.1 hypothetical protein [Psychrilyobacter piezotolerans]RDE64154.1 hypothetical protein DV867_04285 [Psychrilyobacter sp. S5]REI42246.1 hypothetical protein DYH56_04285 [Psychrilyobacter piezotolerans]